MLPHLLTLALLVYSHHRRVVMLPHVCRRRDSTATKIERLAAFCDKLAVCDSLNQKLGVIDADSRLGSEELFLLKYLVAAVQEHVLEIGGGTGLDFAASSLKSTLYALANFILDCYKWLPTRVLCNISCSCLLFSSWIACLACNIFAYKS